MNYTEMQKGTSGIIRMQNSMHFGDYKKCSLMRYFDYKATFFVFTFTMIYCFAEAESRVIAISTQREFDCLRASIISHLDSLTIDTLRIEFSPGIYYYNEGNNLCWGDKDWSGSVVELIGHPDALFIASVSTVSESMSWKNGSICFRDETNQCSPYNYERWSKFTTARDTCAFQLNSLFKVDGDVFSNLSNPVSIQFTEWYSTHVYKIEERNNTSLYFSSDDTVCYENLISDGGQRCVYFPNFDFYNSRGELMPRYRLICNPITNEDGKTLYYCTAGSFANFWNTKLQSFKVQGMHFLCNMKQDYRELFRLCRDTVEENVIVENCSFTAIRGQVLHFEKTNNVTVRNNSFMDCYEDCVVSTNGSDSTIVIGNTFERCGKGMSQNFCVKCSGKDFLIKGNSITSFSYAAIGVGNDLDNRPSYCISGIVEDNEIDNSEYISEDSIMEHTLMDAGAIYTWSWNDNVIIRNNTIEDYGGVHQYRGIFCDQGTKNVTITGNTIRNIVNLIWKEEQSYIEISWRESSHCRMQDHNTGNLCYGNFLDSENARINLPVDYSCPNTILIDVNTQADFDSLNDRIMSCINTHCGRNNILVNLQADSTYTFRDKHINLESIQYPVALKIAGNQANLIPESTSLSISDFASTKSSDFLQPWLRQRYDSVGDSDGWTDWGYAVSPAFQRYASSDEESQVFSVITGHSSLTKGETDCIGMYLHLTEWYTSQVLPIKRITNGIIDFTSQGETALSASELNRDVSQSRGRLFPRYRIYETDFYKCYANAGTFLNVHNSSLAELQVSSIRVNGSYGGNSLINSDSLLCSISK